MFDEGFDETAREAFEAKPLRMGVGVVLAGLAATGLGWKPMAIWLGAMLAIEGFSYLHNKRHPYPLPAPRADRLRILVLSCVLSPLWMIPSILMWFSGQPPLQVAAIAQWMGNLLYLQHFGNKSRLYAWTSGTPMLLTVLVCVTFFSPFEGWSAFAPGALTLMALFNVVAAMMLNLKRHEQLKEAHADLIEQRRAAEAANEAKSAFLAMMSHELRTPMNGVLGMAHALGTTKLSGQQAEYVEVILKSGDGLMTVLNDVLDLSKIEAGRFDLAPEPTDLRDLIERACLMWAEAAKSKGLAFRWQVDAAIPEAVLLDPARLRQMLLNLISNALKFTESGHVKVEARAEQSELVLAVTDTGPGISEAVQDRLFEPFVQADAAITRNHGGTGLGLAICRRLATLMGGQVTLESQLGQGSTFTIRLPLKAADTPGRAASAARQQVPVPPSSDSIRVLVAEDNPTNQKVIRVLLNTIGVEPTVVSDGAEALAALRVDPYDLVFMDIHMPVLDGLQAIVAIRGGQAGRADIPVVALTADAMSGDRERLIAQGFSEHLAKPIMPALLFAAVAAHALGADNGLSAA